MLLDLVKGPEPRLGWSAASLLLLTIWKIFATLFAAKIIDTFVFLDGLCDELQAQLVSKSILIKHFLLFDVVGKHKLVARTVNWGLVPNGILAY